MPQVGGEVDVCRALAGMQKRPGRAQHHQQHQQRARGPVQGPQKAVERRVLGKVTRQRGGENHHKQQRHTPVEDAADAAVPRGGVRYGPGGGCGRSGWRVGVCVRGGHGMCSFCTVYGACKLLVDAVLVAKFSRGMFFCTQIKACWGHCAPPQRVVAGGNCHYKIARPGRFCRWIGRFSGRSFLRKNPEPVHSPNPVFL